MADMTPDTQALVDSMKHRAAGLVGDYDGEWDAEAELLQRGAAAIERLSGERAAIVAWLRSVDWCSESRSYANAFAEQIEQGLHHRAQALADLAEGDAE